MWISVVFLGIWLSYWTFGLSSIFSRFDVTFAVSNSSSKWSTSVFNLSATESVFGVPNLRETFENDSPTIFGSLFRIHGKIRRKAGSPCPLVQGAVSKCTPACSVHSLSPLILSISPKIALIVEEKKNASCSLLTLLDFSLHFTNVSAVLVLHDGKSTPNLTSLFPKASDSNEGRTKLLSHLLRKPGVLVIFLSLAWFPELPALLDNPQVNVSATIQLYSQTSNPNEDPLEENSIKRFIAYGLFLLLFALFLVFIIFCLARLGFRLMRRFRLAHSRSRRSRKLIAATKKVLKRLPVRHLQPVDPVISTGFDQCAICIELFQPQDVIRSLPCKHFYHKACIDPWLLKHRSCPLCKQNILLACGVILEDGLSSSSNSSSSDSSTSSSTSASGNGRNAVGSMFSHFLPPAGQHARDGRLMWMNDSNNLCPPLFGLSCQQRSYLLCFCQRRPHYGRPSAYRDTRHAAINSAGYGDMPASHHPVHFRLNSVSNSSEYSLSSFIQHCRTAEALACESNAKMPTHRWYSNQQQQMRGYLAAVGTTSSSLSSSSSEKRNHYRGGRHRYRQGQRLSTWRLSRLLSRRSRVWCLPWCFIRYTPAARRSAAADAATTTPVCEPEKEVEQHSALTQPDDGGSGGEQNLRALCVHLLPPYSRCHQQPLYQQHPPPLPPAPASAVDRRQWSAAKAAVAPDYACCYSHFQAMPTPTPDRMMPCPGYYRACVHSHPPVDEIVCGVTPRTINNVNGAVPALQEGEEKVALSAGDCLPSYDQVAESGSRFVKAPSFEGSTTSGSDEIRPLSPPTPELPAKRAILLPAPGTRPCEVANPCAAATFLQPSVAVSATSCSVLPMIVKVDVLDQPPPPPLLPPLPPPNPACVSSPDLRPSPGAADTVLPMRFFRSGCGPVAVHDTSALPRDLPPPAYSEIAASPDVQLVPTTGATRVVVCRRSDGGDEGNAQRDPGASKPLMRAVRFFANTLASIGFPTAAAATTTTEQKSCSPVACSRQPLLSGCGAYQRYIAPPFDGYQSCASHGYQRHVHHHPYHCIAQQSTKSEALGISRYHKHHSRSRRNGGGGGAVRCSWRDSRAYSNRIAKTIELEPSGIIKGFPKSSSSSGSMSSASSQQQQRKQAEGEAAHPSSALADSGSTRARFRNVKVTVEPQGILRKCELPTAATEARGGRLPRSQSLPNCALLLQPVTGGLAEPTKHSSPAWASTSNLHN